MFIKRRKDPPVFWEPEDEYLRRIASSAHADLIVATTPHASEANQIALEEFMDFDLTVRDPGQAKDITELFVSAIHRAKAETPVDNVAFIRKNDEVGNNTIGALTLAALISSHRDVWLPFLIVRLDRDVPGERIKFPNESHYGTALAHRGVVLIVDHISYGLEIKEAVEYLERYGARVSYIFSLTCRNDIFDRNSDTASFLSARQIQVWSWFLAEAKEDKGKRQLVSKVNSDLVNWCASEPQVVTRRIVTA